jgi:hypothetical protein
MPFPWTILVRWLLPTIPEIISTVRNMKNEQQSGRQAVSKDDLLGRIEKLEKALELQSQINDQLSAQIHKLQKWLHIANFMAIFGLVLALLALGLLAFR